MVDVNVNTPILGINLGLGLLGGTKEIPDAEHNSHIIDLARFAVDEYNKEQGLALKYYKVDSYQVIPGATYYITLEAANGGLMGKYEAKVFEKAGFPNSRKLEGFKRLQYNA